MKFTIAHLFCGIGGSALGTGAAEARFNDRVATFETIGGIDLDARACRDFERLTGARALCADVHELEPVDLLRFLGPVAPDVIMMSPPCKGFSGLLSAKRAAEPKYQRMNMLMLRALFLVAETWKKPPSIIFVENVPRISSRGKDLVRQAEALLVAAGYAVTTGTHDCGELGGLAQHRRRWFLLARHRATLPQIIYQPRKLRVRACGEVLGPLPMPGDVELGGPMHSIPNLSWRNWVRLALIPAGGDWRDLPGTLDEGEKRREKFRRGAVTSWDATAETVTGPGGSAAAAVADPRSWYANVLRVGAWSEAGGTVTCAGRVSGGALAVADPRIALPPSDGRHWNKYAVNAWSDPALTVTGTDTRVGSGAPSVADPRWGGGRLGVTPWNAAAGTVAGESLPNNGRFSVADPRFVDGKKKNWQRVAGVTPWSEEAPTVTSGAKIHSGAFQVADPRIGCAPRAGAYRVLRWDEAAATITGSLNVDNGAAAIADPRLDPDKPPPLTPMIVAADGTWHRPITTLELGVLQSLPATIDGKPLVLDGTSHTRWREAIGNMVPPAAALEIGNQLLLALLIAKLGAFALSSNDVWVAPDRRVA